MRIGWIMLHNDNDKQVLVRLITTEVLLSRGLIFFLHCLVVTACENC